MAKEHSRMIEDPIDSVSACQIRASSWARKVDPSPTLKSRSIAQQLKRQDKTVYDFGIGEMNPEIPVPPLLVEAMIEAIQNGAMHYSPAAGDSKLLDAISADMEVFGLRYDPEQIVVCPGPKDAIFKVCLSLLNPRAQRRRLLVFPPIYESYRSGSILLTGEPPIFVETDAHFFPDPHRLAEVLDRDSSVALITLNSPNNPTGAVYPLELLEELAEVIARHPQVAVLSDEVYRTILYDGTPHYSLASILPQQTLLLGGMSQRGFRYRSSASGYVAGPVSLVKTIVKVEGNVSSCVHLPTQKGYAHFLNRDRTLSQRFAIRDQLKERRDLLLKNFQIDVPEALWTAPKGAFYFFPDMRPYLGRWTPAGDPLRDDEDLFLYLSREVGVVTVPGSRFGRAGHLRLSYAVNPNDICDGIREMGRALRGLVP